MLIDILFLGAVYNFVALLLAYLLTYFWLTWASFS